MLCCAGFGSISADHTTSNTEIHQNTIFIKQRDIILTNNAWTVIVNLDLSTYEQTIAKLTDDLIYIQKLKTLLAPVHELNLIEYVLQKLEDEINAFIEMLPRLDKRRSVLSAVGSVLKWFFRTATVLGVEELHKIVDKMHRREGDIVLSVSHQMTCLRNFMEILQGCVGLTTTIPHTYINIY